jgi:hypothetical protein
MNYHNTTNEGGEQLEAFKEKAKTQDQEVLRFIKDQFVCSPSYVWKMLYHQSVPLTSVRRAITNLTKEGKLMKTQSKAVGPYGRPEYCWKYCDIQTK